MVSIRIERLTDRALIRAWLSADRGRFAYMLGDLAEPYWAGAHFFGAFEADRLRAVLLKYAPIDPPPVITAGDPAALAAIVAHLADHEKLPALQFHAQPDHLAVLTQFYDLSGVMAMWRMSVTPDTFHRVDSIDRAVRLTGADATDAQAVFDSGLPTDLPPGNLRPATMEPETLDHGVFYGVKEGGIVVALAGTHIISASEGIGTVGYVFTCPEARGKGYATAATGAVTRHLFASGMNLVALNVKQDNPPAIRAYERLGYVRHSALHEGLGTLRP